MVDNLGRRTRQAASLQRTGQALSLQERGMSAVMEPTEVSHCKLDIDAVRADFPALKRTVGDYPLAYLDNTAATLKPQSVIDSLCDFYQQRPSNVHRGIHLLSEEAT